MSPRRRKGDAPGSPAGGDEEPEDGRDDQAEEPAEGTISPSAELEEALREASDAIERKDAAASEADAQPTGKSSADKVTIEALSHELESVRTDVQEKVAALAELEDRHLRLQAEFENFRKRGAREREEAHWYGHQNLVKDLLATVDNLERAIEHAEGGDEGGIDGIVQGVELVHRELLAVLAKYGVSPVESLHEPFDPNVHEAVGQLPSDEGPPNTVVQVLEKGYLIHDRMIRPARVMVSIAAGGETGEEEG